MSDFEDQDDIGVNEEELFGDSKPIHPLSPLGPHDINNGEANEQDGAVLPGSQLGNGADSGKNESAERPVKKKILRVVLNEERLMGKSGIRQLPETFKEVKFKGRGREKEDLHLLLQKMEHWAHVLMPRSQFIDVVDKVESLGSKKRVRSHASDVKLGLEFTNEVREGEENGDENNGGRIESVLGNEAQNGINPELADEITAMMNEDFGDIQFLGQTRISTATVDP